jgi:hypothetical protein
MMAVVRLISRDNEAVVLSNTEITPVGRGFFQVGRNSGNITQVRKFHNQLKLQFVFLPKYSATIKGYQKIMEKLQSRIGQLESNL